MKNCKIPVASKNRSLGASNNLSAPNSGGNKETNFSFEVPANYNTFFNI